MTLRWAVGLVGLLCAFAVVSCAPRGASLSRENKKGQRAAVREAQREEARPSGQPGGLVATEKFTYYCPAHPEITQDMPGACPKDGKFLVAKVPAGAKVQYICPVHNDVVRAAPGKCPKCGRLLEARTTGPPG